MTLRKAWSCRWWWWKEVLQPQGRRQAQAEASPSLSRLEQMTRTSWRSWPVAAPPWGSLRMLGKPPPSSFCGHLHHVLSMPWCPGSPFQPALKEGFPRNLGGHNPRRHVASGNQLD